MSRIAKSVGELGLDKVTSTLEDIAGSDKRIARDDVKAFVKKTEAKDPTLAAAVAMWASFADHADSKAGASLTTSDLPRRAEYTRKELLADYDINNNGYSQAEIDKMSPTAKLLIKLGLELQAKAARRR